MVEEALNLQCRYGVGMAFAVEVNELLDSVAVAVFSTGAEVPSPANGRNLIQQTGWSGLTP